MRLPTWNRKTVFAIDPKIIQKYCFIQTAFENAIWTFFNLIKAYWILWQSIGAYSKVILKTLIVSCHLMVEWQTFDQIVVNAVVKPYRMEKYWFEDTNIQKFQKLIWWNLAKISLKTMMPDHYSPHLVIDLLIISAGSFEQHDVKQSLLFWSWHAMQSDAFLLRKSDRYSCTNLK